MIIAVDETGSFRAGKDLTYGLVTLVSITDSEWVKFSSFMDRLYPNGWKDVKGKLLQLDKREAIFKYLGSKHEIKYTTFLYDLTFGTDEWVNNHKSEQGKRLDKAIEKNKAEKGHPNLNKELELMKRQLLNLSVSDYCKFILIFDLFAEWQKYFQFDCLYVHLNNDSWDMYHYVDTQNKQDRFRGLVMNMLSLTTNELNPEYRINSPVEWQGINHPFDQKYGVQLNGKSGVDGRKFYKNFAIINEQDCPSLILPDVIGNTIHKSIAGRKEKRWLKILKRLKQNRSLTLTNKFTGNSHQYYLVRGFDKEKGKKDINPIIKEHCLLMDNL